MIIVIGGSSYIGKNLCDYLKKKGFPVLGTYNKKITQGMKFFDLQNPDIKNLDIDLKEFKYGIICSAMARIDDCLKNKEKSEKINVIGTKDLIKQFIDNDIKPVFFSSDQVFDGKKGNYNDLDERNPINIYGKQKKIIEDYLLSKKNPYQIIRLSKIFGLKKNDGTLITDWVEKLLKDEEIKCAIDQRLSPTYVGDIARAVEISVKNDLQGCFNVCNPESFTRYDLAMKVKKQLNIKSGKITPCSINDFNFLEKRPLDTSINPSKFINETNFKFMNMEKCIDKLKDIYKL